MQKSLNHYQVTSCGCSHIVKLTSQTDLPKLEACFLEQLKIILPDDKFHLLKHTEQVEDFDEGAVLTDFDLINDDVSIGKLVIKKNLSDITVQKISTLCSVYINQYSLISRINHDQLTKLGNRQGLDDKFTELFGFDKNNKRRSKELNYCLAIFDIDHFKQVNDNFGHLYGDEVLLQLSQLMTSTFRDQDFLFRYGGEEFVAILGDIDIEQAEKVMQRFRELVSQHSFPLVGHITISIGLTHLDRGLDSMSIIERADKALYFAKENGRNQLQIYESLLASGDIKVDNKQDDDITLF